MSDATPNLGDSIEGFLPGTALDVIRIIGGVPIDQALTAAYFTVKADPGKGDETILFQKSITTGSGDDGQLTGPAEDGTWEALFALASTDTTLFEPGKIYYFDIWVKTDAGKPYPSNYGIIRAGDRVRQASIP